jgi:hypothetical protein
MLDDKLPLCEYFVKHVQENIPVNFYSNTNYGKIFFNFKSFNFVY